MIETPNGCTIGYNLLNLPYAVTVGDDVSVSRYLANGVRLSNGDKMYYGNVIIENGTPSKVLFDGGYIDLASNNRYCYFHTDHLGSVRRVTDASGSNLQLNNYKPYGKTVGPNSSNPAYKFIGKEIDSASGLYDFGARHYLPSIASWTTMDPLAEQYYSSSPYAYCGGNPINRIDPDGMDWYKDADGNIIWTEYSSQEELDNNKIEGTYLGQVAIIFEGSLDEHWGDDGTVKGENAKPATVRIYGKNGADDISDYLGMTIPCDLKTYNVLDEGEYRAKYQDMAKSVYGSRGAINKGIRPALTYLVYKTEGNLMGTNPDGKRIKMFDIFFHRNDWSGRAIESSHGCLTIDGRDWKSVEKQIGKSESIYISLKRN